MQPFLTRSTRTSGPSCSLSNAIRSTTSKSTVSASNGSIGSADNTASSVLFRRFGDFYKRFYSAISGNVAAEGNGFWLANERHNVHDHAPVAHGASIREHPGAGIAGNSCDPRLGALPDQQGRRQSGLSPTLIRPFKYSQTGLDRDAGSNGGFERPRNVLSHPNTVEASVYMLVIRFEDHDRMTRSLEREIQRRKLLVLQADSSIERELHRKEMQSLEKVYGHITMHYYDSKVVDLVMEAVRASQSRAMPGVHMRTSRPYLRPFPHYDSPDPPIPLNKSLLNLFHPRTPPPRLLLKISYNLLTSSSAPDLKTYNILIRGFTMLRQNAIAHMVFQSMVDRGLTLDEYSVAAIINLCVKSADFDSYRQVMRILQMQPREGGVRVHRSRMVLAALINGAAKFGRLQYVTVLSRSMRRYYPGSPGLGLFLLTSLLRVCTQKHDWVHGKRAWGQMKELDEAALAEGKEPVTDQRAYRQMYLLCRACGKSEVMGEVLKEARERGLLVEEEILPPKKTKGLHATSEVKVVRLAELTRMHSRYVRPRRQQHFPTEWARRALQRLLETAFDDMGTLSSNPFVVKDTRQDVPEHEPEHEFLERVFLPSLMGPELANEAQISEERSKLWSDIVSERLNILHDGIFCPHEPTESSEKSGESGGGGGEEESLIEKSPMRWRPDLVAYTRGCE